MRLPRRNTLGAPAVRLHDLEQDLSGRLGTPMIVVHTVGGIHPSRLNQAELDQLSRFRFAKRRKDWLLGRNALKEILLTLGQNDDTTNSTHAGSHISLTHAGDTAYAAATPASGRGIGIDYEPVRPLDDRIARWFLTAKEMDWLTKQAKPCRDAELVRLWTVKEAALKSHTDNARMSFDEFSISAPSASVMDVVTVGQRIRVSSCALGSGYLSVAICEETQ